MLDNNSIHNLPNSPVPFHNQPCPEEQPGEKPLLELRGVSRFYPAGEKDFFGGQKDRVHAVVDVDLKIHQGETLGLVGESGSGKTTIGRLIAGLEKPSEGALFYRGEPLRNINDPHRPDLRREVQMVFQDPFSSLNPRQSVYEILSGPLQRHKIVARNKIEQEVNRLLELVGLASDVKYRFPHEFSGGQLQRIAIARALAVRPSLIIADEPVSALDVSIQAQILNLFLDLQVELGLTYLFIGHGLTAVNYVSTRVAVMYLGRIVEFAPSRILFSEACHPYTRALLGAIPVPDPMERDKHRILLEGELPSNIHLPSGCSFHPRCPMAEPSCKVYIPPIRAANEFPCHCRQSHCLACPIALRDGGIIAPEEVEGYELNIGFDRDLSETESDPGNPRSNSTSPVQNSTTDAAFQNDEISPRNGGNSPQPDPRLPLAGQPPSQKNAAPLINTDPRINTDHRNTDNPEKGN